MSVPGAHAGRDRPRGSVTARGGGTPPQRVPLCPWRCHCCFRRGGGHKASQRHPQGRAGQGGRSSLCDGSRRPLGRCWSELSWGPPAASLPTQCCQGALGTLFRDHAWAPRSPLHHVLSRAVSGLSCWWSRWWLRWAWSVSSFPRGFGADGSQPGPGRPRLCLQLHRPLVSLGFSGPDCSLAEGAVGRASSSSVRPLPRRPTHPTPRGGLDHRHPRG